MTLNGVGINRILRPSKFLCWVIALAFAAGAVGSRPALAALAFELRTGNDSTSSQSMIIDSNQCPSKGPTSMYVGGTITNTGGATVTDIVATLSGLNANVYFAGGQAAAQTVGALGPGESIGIYWFTGYGCTENSTATPTVQISSSAGVLSRSLTLTVRKAISAAAGGNVLSATLGPGAVVGQTLYFDANYDFGGTSANDEYFLQPAGGQNFNAGCFRLVGSEILSSNVHAAPAGTLNRLYFVQPDRQTGNGYYISVRYSFQYLCANTSSVARPYAVQTSGSTNIKYTGNFDGTGSISISYPGATNPFTITKSVSSSVGFVGVTDPLTYTVTITNPSVYSSLISKIVDVLPAGMTFVALDPSSDVTLANSSSTPTAGATGTLTFLGKLGQSYAIAPGGSVTLKYTVNRPAGAGSFTNNAQAHFGLAATPVAQVTFQQVAPFSLTATKASTIISDPFDGTVDPKAIPGATVSYCILVSNPGAAAASSVVATDAIPGTLTYVAGSMKSGTSCATATTPEDDDATGTDESDPFGASITGVTITASASSLNAASSMGLVFDATVN